MDNGMSQDQSSAVNAQTTSGTPAVSWTATARRHAGKVRCLSAGLMVLSGVLLLRQIPVEPLVNSLEEWVQAWGNWGPFLYGLIYVAAVVLLIPGSALSLTAGVLFGRLLGTIVVSLSSTSGAALAFLISRYLARERVAAYVRQRPRLQAIDQAVREGGWRIVALLRLSPVIPFNVQNYLYGITGIRFGPYVLTSWLTMLPGTVLYVYLGALGRQSLESVGGQRRRTPEEWAFLIVGLLATLAVTLYLARLARKVRSQRGLQITEGKREEASPASLHDPRTTDRWPWGTTMLLIAALAVVSTTILVRFTSSR
jgi:uncharacterized membrane protein YdjX (TVP38/TMEM64 family)